MRLSVLSAVVLTLGAGPALAQETIENAEFTSWSKFKKGTTITTKVSQTAGGMTTETTFTLTLADVAADKVVLDSSTVIKAMGMEFKQPAVKRDVPKTIALPKGTPKPPAPGTKPEGTYGEGTETLKVGGTEVKAKWYKVKSDMGGIKSDVKMWVSEDIPGGMVKMEATTSAPAASESKLEIVEFKKP